MKTKYMNRLKLLFLVFISLTLISCSKNETGKTNSDTKYTAYYFHPTARCESCLNLEAFTKEIIETKYSKDGFTFQSVNTDSKENEHYRKDYDLKFSSLIIVKHEGVKQVKWTNLDSVWSYTGNKDKFFKYTENEIQNFIKE